jgi:hypothetical protein
MEFVMQKEKIPASGCSLSGGAEQEANTLYLNLAEIFPGVKYEYPNGDQDYAPPELKEYRQWLAWRFEERGGNIT